MPRGALAGTATSCSYLDITSGKAVEKDDGDDDPDKGDGEWGSVRVVGVKFVSVYWFSVKWSSGPLPQASVRRAPMHEFFEAWENAPNWGRGLEAEGSLR
ncbi:MAG: hypothetical protein V1790_15425, partial [Planctomycetota bacterium]